MSTAGPQSLWVSATIVSQGWSIEKLIRFSTMPFSENTKSYRNGPPRLSQPAPTLRAVVASPPAARARPAALSWCRLFIIGRLPPLLAQRVVIERVRVGMPARWASNHESPLALLEYGGYGSGGAALNARRWRRRFVPQRHENGFHNQSPWFGRGDFPASSRAACRTTAPRDVMAITKRAYRPSLSRNYAFTRNDFCRMTIAALAVALGAFDAEHVELALDVAAARPCRRPRYCAKAGCTTNTFESEFSAHTGQNRTRRLAGANCKS